MLLPDEGGLSSKEQQYQVADTINRLRHHVDQWRMIPNPNDWRVTPETAADACHVNWVVLDSDWEGEFCRVAEEHPKVLAYVKNHGLGLEVPYKYGSETRRYLPDFIVQINDGHGPDDPLNLVVEIKGYRKEDAKDKKLTMDSYWIPGVNPLGTYGRWAFAEFTDVWEMGADFEKEVESRFGEMVVTAMGGESLK